MTTAWGLALLLGGVVVLGASVQRLAGIGFALVTVPALALLLGPAHGVALSNCGSGAISAIGLASGWRRVRLTAMVPLIAAAACTVPAGAWVAAHLPGPVLLAGTGTLITAAVVFIMRGTRVHALRGAKGAVAVGAASGFMNSSAGIGGPAMSLYALNADWPVPEFVPNAQFYGVAVNVFSIAAKGPPPLTAPAWLTTATGIAAGAVIGRALTTRMPERAARRTVLLLALAGGLTTLAKGLWTLTA